MVAAQIRGATAMSLLAAFLWASYYGFVLVLEGRISPLALTVYPFLVGGVAYSAFSAYRGEGRALLRLFLSPEQWGRIGLFLGIQVSIVYITLVNGAVDAALLSLLGDVAVTPLFVMLAFEEGRDRLSSPVFLGGVLLSAAGASLTIVAGGGLVGLAGLSLLIAPLLPLLVAGFFISAARAGRDRPITAIAGQAALVAGLAAAPWALLLPVPLGSLAVPGGGAAVLLIGTGITSFFLAPLLYFRSIQRAGIFLPSLLMAAIPVFTLLFAALVGKQYPTPLGLLGVPVAVAGATLAVRGSQSSENPYQPA